MLLDTCVVSDLARPSPDPALGRWFEATPESDLHLSVLTLGEIAKGCEMLPAGPKRRRLEAWLLALRTQHAERVLVIDSETAETWGRLAGETSRRGVVLSVIDGLIAATALRHGLTVVTRNVDDFAPSGVRLLNPYSEAQAP